MGRGGGQVRVLAFFSDDTSSNPAEAYNFLWKFLLYINWLSLMYTTESKLYYTQ